MELTSTIQLVVYAVLVTAVIVNVRSENKSMRDWLTAHEKREEKRLNELKESVDELRISNVAEHLTFTQQVGRLQGKVGINGS